MATAVLNWKQLSVADKILKTRFFIYQMTENAASFPSPYPALTDVQTEVDKLTLAAVKAMTGAHLHIYFKNVTEADLDNTVKSLQAYVQNVSNGDEDIIRQSGMDVKRGPSLTPDPLQVENLSASPTKHHGEVQLYWNRLDNAIAYRVEQWIQQGSEDGFWDRIGTPTRSKYLVTGLTTGTVYRYRVAGIGKDDILGPFSQEASSVAA